MIEKAVIQSKIDLYRFKVRIPSINKIASAVGGTSDEDLFEATVLNTPGINPHYDAGDVVFVEYENDDIRKPVIIGLLYHSEQKLSSSDIVASSMNVLLNSKFSNDICIGDVDYRALSSLISGEGPTQQQILQITQNLKQVSDDLYGGLIPSGPTCVTAVLAAAAWEDASQDVVVNGVTSTNNIRVGIDGSCTQEQRHEASVGRLFCTGQFQNLITVVSDGVVPSIDIPIVVEIWNQNAQDTT